MNGPNGIQLDQLIGETDRGTLWHGTRQRKDDRIVRIVNPRFCDSRFRQSLKDLCNKQHPRMIPIIGEGWAGVHFYIEYRTDSQWQSLESYFKKLHWRARLAVIAQICDVLPLWNKGPIHPLGLNGRNIIMVNDVGRWFPWLLPCPPANYSTPCDLFGSDPPIISTIAPEVIRDIYFYDRAKDNYALGTLAIHALGCKESREAITDEDIIEAQARGALLNCELKSSEVEPFLHDIEPLKQLIRVVQHYTQISPVARPIESTELKNSCANAFSTTEPVALALDLVKHSNIHEALKILQWGFQNFGENIEGRLLAAHLCKEIDELPLALEHLDHAVSLSPDDLELRRQRCNLRWLLYQKLPPLTAGDPDHQGDLLINDLALLKSLSQSDPIEKNLFYIMTAQIHRRRHDLEKAAKELYDASKLEPADMNALYLYGQCWKDMGDRNALTQVVQEAHRRIGRMAINEMMEELEAQKWREKFNALLSS